MDASTPRIGRRDHPPTYPVAFHAWARSVQSEGTIRPITPAITVDRVDRHRTTPDPDGDDPLTRSGLEAEAILAAGAFGHAPTSDRTRGFAITCRWLFDFLVDQAGLSPAEAIHRSQLREAAEDLLFRDGEAAFNRTLTPVVRHALALRGETDPSTRDHDVPAGWLSILGLSRVEAITVLARSDIGRDDDPACEALLRAIRELYFGRSEIGLVAV